MNGLKLAAMARTTLPLLLGLNLCLAACSDDDKDKSRPASKEPERVSVEPTPTPATPSETPPATDAPPAEGSSDEPCALSWSDGRRMTFESRDDAIALLFDTDGDGKPNTCGTYQRSDGGRITSFKVDEGCDDSTETSLSFEYDDEVNLASAKEAGRKGKTYTMVVLPAYVGAQPGYLLEGPRAAMRVDAKDGLVRSIETTKARGAARKKATFVYGTDKRLAALQEDQGIDGSIDVRHGYHYDQAGKLVGVSTVAGDLRSEGTFDYACR